MGVGEGEGAGWLKVREGRQSELSGREVYCEIKMQGREQMNQRQFRAA